MTKRLPNKPKRRAVPKGDYNVGYAKPPVDHQFQKGKSGNPGGRPPKERRSNFEILQEVFDGDIEVMKNGKVEKVPYLEAYLMKLRQNMLLSKGREQLSMLMTLKKERIFNMSDEYRAAINAANERYTSNFALSQEDSDMLDEIERKYGKVLSALPDRDEDDSDGDGDGDGDGDETE